MGMAVVVAFVEERHFPFLLEGDGQLQQEREREGHQRGFKGRGQSAGDALERGADLVRSPSACRVWVNRPMARLRPGRCR